MMQQQPTRRRSLLETIVDDAFDVDPFILEDFPFAAYYELVAAGGGAFTSGSVVWWPKDIYEIVHKHPFWQGRFPHKKKKKRAHSTSPMERNVRTREIHRRVAIARDEITVMELLLSGEL
jgi:hypothetical protein